MPRRVGRCFDELLAITAARTSEYALHEYLPSATASPHGDMISVQPMFISPSRSTAAGQANAYGKLVRTAVVVGKAAASTSSTTCGSVRSAVALPPPLMSI